MLSTISGIESSLYLFPSTRVHFAGTVKVTPASLILIRQSWGWSITEVPYLTYCYHLSLLGEIKDPRLNRLGRQTMLRSRRILYFVTAMLLCNLLGDIKNTFGS